MSIGALARTRGMREGSLAVLALQRAAGNRAALAAMRRTRAGARVAHPTLARCQGACKCGGACEKRGNDDEFVVEWERRLQRAVADRRAGKGVAAVSRGAGRGRILARQTLTSPRFVGEPLLEDCFENKARMGGGAHDTAEHQPVSKVQQALLDWGAMKAIAVDLGSTGPAGNGVDGVYGSKTAAAVRLFKAGEHLGSEQYGDVGPGTMDRLDRLFPAPGPTPPPPPPPTPPPNPDAEKIQQAKDDRDTQLRKVTGKLDEMASLVLRGALRQPGEEPVPTVQEKFPREVCVIQFWLHASPSDDDYLGTLTKARGLVERDRTASQPLIARTGHDCVTNPAHGWSVVGNPAAGTQLCDQWFDTDSRHCRSDVLIHETYHTLGSHHDGVDFPTERTPSDAFDNADTMTQFGNDMIGLSVDNCGHTQRSGTAATTIAACVAALRTVP